MKRLTGIALTALSIAIVVFAAGCATGKSGEKPEPTGQTEGERTVQEDRVVVSRSIEFAQVNERPYGVLESKDDIETFAKAIRTGNKMEGQLDIDFPDYDIVVDQDGKRKEIHLWLDRRSTRGMFTYVSDTGTGYTLTEKSTAELVELIWEMGYELEQAVDNGDVVPEMSGGVRNGDIWKTFVDNVKNGKLDDVQVVHYTIEGGHVFYNFIFNGDSLRLRFDSSHDAFANPEDVTDYCEGIQAVETEQGTIYTLEGCGNSETWFELMLPEK